MPSDSKAVVLVTGANVGIGFETVIALGAISSKYHVIIGARTPSKGEAALKEIQQRNPSGSFSLVQLDVTDQASIEAAAKKISEEYGRLDTLVNNAGIVIQNGSLLEQMRGTFETNTFGAAAVTEALLPLLEKSSDARLVYVTSGLGSLTIKADSTNLYYSISAAAYRMSKSAMNMLMLTQHSDFSIAGKKIKVWAFDPGYTISNLTGEDQREHRKQTGALDTDVPGKALAGLVDGKLDEHVGKVVDYEGRVVPW